MGYQAGQYGQGRYGILLGFQAGSTGQLTGSISIGYQAGQANQGTSAISLGINAGSTAQQQYGIAIGTNAGQITQGTAAIAIGYQAGSTGQGQNAIAIGNQAGSTAQGSGSIAIGFQAGNATSMGVGSICIGNATAAITASSCVISPLRNLSASNTVYYNATSGELFYNTSSELDKTNIVNITQDTTNIYKIQPRSYIYTPDGKANVGFIAQEVNAIDSTLAVIDDTGNVCNVSWDAIVTYLVSEIQVLNTKITTQAAEITTIKSTLNLT